MIIFWMGLFYKGALEAYSPARLAQSIPMPVMMIHGEKDRRFPLSFALKLRQSFPHERTAFYLAEGAGHSDSSRTGGYGPAVKAFIDDYLDSP
jgi:fermentation-respiration switch protein FrsA (DUF1100 family)